METIERYRSELLSPDGLDYKPLATHPERTTILFELLRPYGFQRPVVYELSKHLAEGTAGAKFYSPTHLLIHGVQLLELLPREGGSKQYPYPLTSAKTGSAHFPSEENYTGSSFHLVL